MENSLAYKVANIGYDVWLGNSRGSVYSRNHGWLDPEIDSKEFFDYSFYEMAKYDEPSMIDYVLNFTEQSKVTYVGHS